jgi:hypothetical protein
MSRLSRTVLRARTLVLVVLVLYVACGDAEDAANVEQVGGAERVPDGADEKADAANAALIEAAAREAGQVAIPKAKDDRIVNGNDDNGDNNDFDGAFLPNVPEKGVDLKQNVDFRRSPAQPVPVGKGGADGAGLGADADAGLDAGAGPGVNAGAGAGAGAGVGVGVGVGAVGRIEANERDAVAGAVPAAGGDTVKRDSPKVEFKFAAPASLVEESLLQADADNKLREQNEANGEDNTREQPAELVLRLSHEARFASGDKSDPVKREIAQNVHIRKLESYILKFKAAPDSKDVDSELNDIMCEGVKAKLAEQERAFAGVMEEKRYLADMLREEEQTLAKLNHKVQNPDLGMWIKTRAARVKVFFETPETDAAAYYAGRFVNAKVSAARERINYLEEEVEKSVDVVLPARYGGFVALVLSAILVGFPVAVTALAITRITKSISLRQHVLLGNLFFASLVIGVCGIGLVLRQDPLRTLYDAAENMFVLLQLALACAYTVFILTLVRAARRARDNRDLVVFGSELVFYLLVGMNYHARVFRPAMLGLTLDTSKALYIVYAVDFCAMIALTVSSASSEYFGDDEDDDEDAGVELLPRSITSAAAASRSGILRVFTSVPSMGGKQE